jgi:hypothetical protein
VATRVGISNASTLGHSNLFVVVVVVVFTLVFFTLAVLTYSISCLHLSLCAHLRNRFAVLDGVVT